MSFICENVVGQQNGRNDIMKNLITENYALAESQYTLMIKSVPSGKLPLGGALAFIQALYYTFTSKPKAKLLRQKHYVL
jgi:hypothetical protein